MIEGLSHVTFIVKDIARTALFLKMIFDAEEVYSSGDATFSISREKFFMIGDVWVVLMEGEALAGKTYNHVAFKIPEAAFDDYASRVAGLGVEVLPGRSRIEGEGRSIYFYDYDNHLFELHTGTLAQRLKAYGAVGRT